MSFRVGGTAFMHLTVDLYQKTKHKKCFSTRNSLFSRSPLTFELYCSLAWWKILKDFLYQLHVLRLKTHTIEN